jgi:hypothetical protein
MLIILFFQKGRKTNLKNNLLLVEHVWYFRNGDGTALRVPLRTEEQLKQLSSHSLSTPASNGISGYIKQEIKQHDIMFTFLGTV